MRAIRVVSADFSNLPPHLAQIFELIVQDNTLVSEAPRDPNARFVWRMVAFYVSDEPQHHIMPLMEEHRVTPPPDKERSAYVDELLRLADLITDTIPKEEWEGVARWARVLGLF